MYFMLLIGFPFRPPEPDSPSKEEDRNTNSLKTVVVENSLWVLHPRMERQS